LLQTTGHAMQLLVRSPDGALSATTISGDCTVAQLKMTVENETFVPAEFQRLIVASEQLSDEDACLSDCGLASGMTVELVMDVEGGKGDHRYKKSTSRMRWKWNKKRTRRLQRKRRKMRMRAR